MKLDEVFNIGEASSVQKASHDGPSALKQFGIDLNAVETAQDLQAALSQIHSMLMFGLNALKAKGSRLPDVGQNFGSEIDSVLRDVSKLRKVKATSGEAQGTQQKDPRTGWADDPNPATQGSMNPRRGYRSS